MITGFNLIDISIDPFSASNPEMLYLITYCNTCLVFASQLLFTTSIYAYFGKRDFGVKYGLVRAGPGLAVLAFGMMMKTIEIFKSWSGIYHGMTGLCVGAGLLTVFLTNHRIVRDR